MSLRYSHDHLKVVMRQVTCLEEFKNVLPISRRVGVQGGQAGWIELPGQSLGEGVDPQLAEEIVQRVAAASGRTSNHR